MEHVDDSLFVKLTDAIHDKRVNVMDITELVDNIVVFRINSCNYVMKGAVEEFIAMKKRYRQIQYVLSV